MSWRAVGAIGGIAAPVVFTAATMLAASRTPGFDHTIQFISELGATGASTESLMNWFGFAPTGILFVLFGISLVSLLPSSTRLLSVAALLMIAFGFGVTISGYLSCDIGCPQFSGSSINSIHNTIGPLAFVSSIVSIGLVGASLWRSARNFAVYSLVSSLLALICLILLASSLETRELTGVWQRAMLTAIFQWSIITGYAMLSGRLPRSL